MNIICPVCKEILSIENHNCSCKNGHSFDVAKEGYVNLLLSNKKNSQDPGDNKLMVNARYEFLNKGYYNNLLQGIITLINKYKKEKIALLDVGCGTGYYSTGIVKSRNMLDNLVGIDISKYAVRKAAKLDKNSKFLVASSFDLPINNESVDVILNVFSPKANKEFLRVLKQDGILVEVMAGRDHMLEVKQAMYENVRLNDVEIKYDGFKNIESKEIKYSVNLNNDELRSQISMTPYFYKTNETDLNKLYNVKDLNVTLDFIINIWEKE